MNINGSSSTLYSGTGSSSNSILLTNNNNNSAIYVAAMYYAYLGATGGFNWSVSISDHAKLSWSLRGNPSISFIGTSTRQYSYLQILYVWEAKSKNKLTSDTIILDMTTNSSVTWNLAIIAYSINGTSLDLDNNASTYNTSSSPSVNLTTNYNDDFISGIVGVYQGSNSISFTPGSGFTSIVSAGDNSTTSIVSVYGEYVDNLNSGTNSVDASISSSQPWFIVADSLREPFGGSRSAKFGFKVSSSETNSVLASGEMGCALEATKEIVSQVVYPEITAGVGSIAGRLAWTSPTFNRNPKFNSPSFSEDTKYL